MKDSSNNKKPKILKLARDFEKEFLSNKTFDYSNEERWYEYWLEKKFFNSSPNPEKEPYTVVIPPPNVTGILHMGHVLNNTIQDILVRRQRMMGKEACWVPGTDHASIATEAKVVAMLKDKGIEKKNITREEFLKYAWEWKDKYGGIILNQLKKLGASCDWDRTKFTMDEDLSKAVIQSFIELHNEGLVYRGSRMINWDPEGKTALSDDEVIHREVQGKLYYLKYKIHDSSDYLTIATTRPETIMGDTALCVNPDDDRYHKFIGKEAIIPITKRIIPIIADYYVDKEFGTGCLKVTPSHDINDAELGRKHNLDFIDILNDDGTLNSNGDPYKGMDRFAVREKIIKDIESEGNLEKIEDHTHKVGFSERTNAVVEPKISTQWFVKMKQMSEAALENVENDNISFFPKKLKNMYKSWMENINDWCISRQLWWGHRIPAYYLNDGSYVVAKSPEEALQIAKSETQNLALTIEDLRQDEDVLDTWFSSWLWPISVFDGFNDPNNEDINYYYPTNDLVTAPEIMFFWVARMIMAGYKFRGEKPFSNVYFTGIVRDSKKRKMSKSLGNSPDPIELMNKYGTDGVRMGMMLCAPAGNDLLFDEKLCEQGRNFINKVWNALKLIKKFDIDKDSSFSKKDMLAIEWFKNKLKNTIREIDHKFTDYKLSEAIMIIYKLFWDDFCSSLLEIIKPKDKKSISAELYEELISIFETIMKILHPFMPFITEEVYHILRDRTENDSICISKWPMESLCEDDIDLTEFELALELISTIRKIKKEHNISKSSDLELIYDSNLEEWFEKYGVILTHLENLSIGSKKSSEYNTKIDINFYNSKVSIYANVDIDYEKEIQKLQSDLKHYQSFKKSIEVKLNNSNFVGNAPQNVVDMEKKKLGDTEIKIKLILESIERLSS